MNARRAASVVLAVAAAASLATGTMGFTSASAERGVQVNVVEPEDAYVGVQAYETSQGQGSDNPVCVLVTNQHTDAFTVEKIETDTGAVLEPNENRADLAVGARQGYTSLHADDSVTVHVSGGFEATVNVDVEPTVKGNCPNAGGNNGGNSNAGGSGKQSS